MWTGLTLGSCSQPLLCPSGDRSSTISVTIRDQFMSPMAGIGANEVYAEAPSCLLTAGSPCAQVTRFYAASAADASGRTTIPVFGGGRPGELLVTTTHKVLCQLKTLRFASVDSDGDGAATLADLSHLADVYNHSASESADAARCDFDCSGRVGLSDLSLFVEHYGHACH